MAIDPASVARSWLAAFEQLCCSPDADGGDIRSHIANVFSPADCWLRDMLTLSWDLRTLQGPEVIHDFLSQGDRLRKAGLKNFEIDFNTASGGASLQQSPLGQVVLVLFRFDITTPAATGRGCARLVQQPDGEWKAWTVLTLLHDFIGLEEDLSPATNPTEKTWDEAWEDERASVQEDLGVLVVGAGHSGVMLAARLKQMKLKYLVIERNRLGDSWMLRYPTLKLHTPIKMNSFPYQPFPTLWPKYLPRSKVAQFIRTYVDLYDLHVWESTELLHDPRPAYNLESKTWTVHVRKGEEVVTLHPRHLVLATGLNGRPRQLQIPGAEQFKGEVYHSHYHRDSDRLKVKNVVIIGVCNSGADLALNLVQRGAGEITVVQRSPVSVLSVKTVDTTVHSAVYPPNIPLDECDMLSEGMPHRLLIRHLRGGLDSATRALDRELLDGLDAAGFKISDTPLYELFLTVGGGFLLDVGAAQHIISGRVKVKHGVEVARLEPDSVVFTDGSSVAADVVIMAIGYEGMRDTATQLLGPDVVDKTPDVWGLDEEGEFRGIYRPTGYPRLWYASGGFPQGRFLAQALQILAIERGIVDA